MDAEEFELTVVNHIKKIPRYVQVRALPAEPSIYLLAVENRALNTEVLFSKAV